MRKEQGRLVGGLRTFYLVEIVIIVGRSGRLHASRFFECGRTTRGDDSLPRGQVKFSGLMVPLPLPLGLLKSSS